MVSVTDRWEGDNHQRIGVHSSTTATSDSESSYDRKQNQQRFIPRWYQWGKKSH